MTQSTDGRDSHDLSIRRIPPLGEPHVMCIARKRSSHSAAE